MPVLADAQITPATGPELSAGFRQWLWDGGDAAEDELPAINDLRAFFADFLDYARPGMLVPREELPDDLIGER